MTDYTEDARVGQSPLLLFHVLGWQVANGYGEFVRGVPSFLGRETPHDMLATLQREKLVLDWRKRQQSRAAVQSTIRDMLDRLPPSYGKELYDKKVAQAYQHIYEGYYGAGRSLYTGVG